MNQLKTLITILTMAVSSGCASTGSKDKILFIPEKWNTTKTSKFTQLTSPEKDLKVYYFKQKVSETTNYSSLSKQLWKSVNSDFSDPELMKSEPPSENWDKVVRIIYNSPSEKNISTLTSFKIKSNIAYITLISGSNSTLSKRGTQLSQSASSFRPEVFPQKDLSKIKPRDFKEIEKSFVRFLTSTQKKLEIPGVAIGIFQNGRVVFNKGFGNTHSKGGTAVNPDTQFMIGSITKPLTTLMITKLIQDNKIKWNDPVEMHLPSWRLDTQKATQSILMKHTACACTGMPRRDLDFIFEIDDYSAEDRMKQMANMAPTTAPGETFQYSNYLVATGGFAAAHVFSPKKSLLEAYKQAMTELVFQPLKMKNSHITNTKPYRINSAYPHSYDINGKVQPVPVKLEEFANSIAPAGSIWSTTSDMLKYIELELSNSSSASDYISKKHLFSRHEKSIQISEKTYYGKGLFIQKIKNIQTLGHNGNTLGHTADLVFFPEKNFGYVLLTNIQGANTFTKVVAEKIISLLFGDKSFAEKSLEHFLKERKKGILLVKDLLKTDIFEMDKLTGNYKSSQLGPMKITKKKDKLVADFGEFKSEIKEIKDKGRQRVFLLSSPPWSGSISLLLEKKNFILEGAQKTYIFEKL